MRNAEINPDTTIVLDPLTQTWEKIGVEVEDLRTLRRQSAGLGLCTGVRLWTYSTRRRARARTRARALAQMCKVADAFDRRLGWWKNCGSLAKPWDG